MMLDQLHTSFEMHGLLREHDISSHRKMFDTPRQSLLLQNLCSASLVESLKADDGLRAFARLPEREHELLLKIANNSACMLTLAYTCTGVIVGQVTLAPASTYWEDMPDTYEIAVEVSADWRQQGIARRLLLSALSFEDIEQKIIVGMGLSWHWDMSGLGLDRYRYRELIARLFAAHSFSEYLTSEPNICMDPANILLVRIGDHVQEETMNEFFQRLLQSDVLPGM